MVKDIQSYGIIMGRSPLIILSQFHPRPYSQIVDICVGRYICESVLLAQIDFIKTDCILTKLEKCVKWSFKTSITLMGVHHGYPIMWYNI